MLFNIIIHCSKRETQRYEIYDIQKQNRDNEMSKILKVANGGGATRTKIMYSAFLSYSQLKQYLIVLTQNYLISYDLNTRTFKTTEKGLSFLKAYEEMNGMMKASPPQQV